MTVSRDAALPSDYHRRLAAVEDVHWWHTAMRELTRTLLGDRFERSRRLLDAGCGTGGFLRWAVGERSFDTAAGVDVSEEAIAFARNRVPRAELRVAPIWELPFPDGAFDLVVCNDVLQHVPEPAVQRSIRELRRVLDEAGTLFVRTNGARRARRARTDWRVYDRRTLADALTRAGFRADRVTYANVVGSAVAVTRRRAPRAPTAWTDGIPTAPGAAAQRTAAAIARVEGRVLANPRRALPWGHTLLAVATRADEP